MIVLFLMLQVVHLQTITPGGPGTGWNSRHGEYGHVAGDLFGTGMANSVSAYRGIRPAKAR